MSEYIGKEVKGISYSSNASGDATDIVIGGYENNSKTDSYGSPTELARKYGSEYSTNNILLDGKLGATQSNPELSQDVKNMQQERQYSAPNASYIILYRIKGQKRLAEYPYTHEYRPPKRKN